MLKECFVGMKETTVSSNWLDLSNNQAVLTATDRTQHVLFGLHVGCSYKRGKEPSGHVCGCGRAAYAENPCYSFFYFCTDCLIELVLNNVPLRYLFVLFCPSKYDDIVGGRVAESQARVRPVT